MHQVSIRPYGFCLVISLMFCAVLTSPVPCLAANQSRDIYLSGLVIHTKLPEGSIEAKEHGSYPRITSYDLHGGLAPDKVDVVVVANGGPNEDATIVLEVFPVVGLTNWSRTEGITDVQLLESSKTRLSAILRLEKSLRLKGRTEVKFAEIDISKIAKHFARLGLWPATLIFKATAEPVTGETSISNNVMEVAFGMKPMD